MDAGEARLVEIAVDDAELDLVYLALVAKIHLEVVGYVGAGHAFRRENGRPLRGHRLEGQLHGRRVGLGQRSVIRAHEVVAEIGLQHSERAEDTRVTRNQQAVDADVVGDCAGMNGARAARDDDSEAARIVASLDRTSRIAADIFALITS